MRTTAAERCTFQHPARRSPLAPQGIAKSGTSRRRTSPSFLLSTASKPKRIKRAVCAGIVREHLPKDDDHYRKARSEMRGFLWLLSAGVGCSRGLAWAHNPKVAGSNPAPATMNDEGLADAAAANPLSFTAARRAARHIASPRAG